MSERLHYNASFVSAQSVYCKSLDVVASDGH